MRPELPYPASRWDSGDGPILQVENLSVEFPTREGLVHAVEDVSFRVEPGEVLGVVGESGSGKSVTALAIMGLLPKRSRVRGAIRFRGRDLLALDRTAMRDVRGREISMIFQDPMTALNPVLTVGRQLVEMIRRHQDLDRQEARREALELMDLVGIPAPQRRIDQFPHELSGGMCQRIVIAIAIANRPLLVIADEPTTALDVTIQAQVMEVMTSVQAEVGSALMLITHDLGLVAGTADRVQVMYGGRIMETAPANSIFAEGANPYTLGLLRSLPRLDESGETPLFSIRGAPPSAILRPEGCAFHPRCDYATDQCVVEPPPMVAVGADHLSRCHHIDRVLAGSAAVAESPP
ncbi:MAG TPA: ABC transporter ATP-binding protein [Acidimicrobiia bacterium]|nr:ABC transporter ATP-binding protein [Acidimicrobiia bacterium]